jgi:hypothetical protein
VLIEAGHRCAIPTCREPTTDVHHIVPWKECRKHEFENLIALCANCHRRCRRGEIDRTAQRIYKANLGLIGSRYSHFERRILDELAQHPQATQVRLPAGYGPLVYYLLRDGILAAPVMDARAGGVVTAGVPVAGFEIYAVTDAGRAVVQGYVSATPMDPEEETPAGD